MSAATMNGTNASAFDIFNMTATAGGNFESCPPGNHPAVVIGLIDVGTQNDSYQGQPSRFRKAVILFEIANKKQSNGQPFVFGLEMSLSFGPKSKIRELAESLLNRKFAEKDKFSLPDLLNRCCLANVIESQSGDKKYSNLKSIASYPDGFPAVAPTLGTVLWAMNCGRPFPEDEWMPRIYGNTVKQILEQSEEWRAQHGGPAAGAEAPSQLKDEDIPF